MSVYTVRVKARPRPTVTKIRRRLKGLALSKAQAALKYLQECVNHDSKLTGGPNDVPAARLIFAGDANALTDVAGVISLLQEAVTSTLKTIKS